MCKHTEVLCTVTRTKYCTHTHTHTHTHTSVECTHVNTVDVQVLQVKVVRLQHTQLLYHVVKEHLSHALHLDYQQHSPGHC